MNDKVNVTNRQRVNTVKAALKEKFPSVKFLVPRAHSDGKVFVNWIDGPSVNEVIKVVGESQAATRMDWKRSFTREKAQILIDQLVKDGAAPDLFEITRSHWCKSYLPRVICAPGFNKEMDVYRGKLGNLIKGWNMLIS